MPTIKSLIVTDAASALAYTTTDKKDQVGERVLYAAGQHCQPRSAARGFEATRRRHGTNGTTRTVKASYTLPEPGETPSYVRDRWPNGRRYWRVARDGEDATHVRHEGVAYEYAGRGAEGATHKLVRRRYVEAGPDEATHVAIEGGQVREAEARHVILSFGLHEVNPNDPEQCAAAFRCVVDFYAEQRPGIQTQLIAQADGTAPLKGSRPDPKFHVHAVENATVFADMELGGRTYRAAHKQAGDLSDVYALRAAFDDWLAERGSEYGLGPQVLPQSVRDPAVQRRVQDRRAEAAGQRSDADVIRDAIEAALDDPRAVDVEGLRTVLAEHDVEAHHRTTRTGRNAGQQRISFKLPHMPRFTGARTLGSRYGWDDSVIAETGEVVEGLGSQLECNATGRPRQPRPARWRTPPPRAASTPTQAELDEAQRVVDELARRARELVARLAREAAEAAAAQAQLQAELAELEPWLAAWAEREGVTVDELLNERGLWLDDAEDRRIVWEWKRQADRAAHEADHTLSSAHATTVQSEEPAFDEEAWFETPPEKPGMSFTEAAQRGLPLDQVMAVGRAWDEWRAYERSEAFAEHQRASQEAAEAVAQEAAESAAREVAEPTSSAHAPVVDHPVSAHAATGQPTVFVSSFTDVHDENPKREAVLRTVEAFENTYQPTIVAGGRVGEACFPKGLGPAFLKRHAQVFDPAVLTLMTMREDRKEENRAWFAEARDDAAQIEVLRAEREADDPTGWYMADDVKELRSKRKRADRLRDEQLARMAEGDFEPRVWRRPGEDSGGGSGNRQEEQDKRPQSPRD